MHIKFIEKQFGGLRCQEKVQPVTKINFTTPPIEDNRHNPQPNGITPPIDGEFLKSVYLIPFENLL